MRCFDAHGSKRGDAAKKWSPQDRHLTSVLRNLLVLLSALDFLSKHKKLMGAKGLRTFLRASWDNDICRQELVKVHEFVHDLMSHMLAPFS